MATSGRKKSQWWFECQRESFRQEAGYESEAPAAGRWVSPGFILRPDERDAKEVDFSQDSERSKQPDQ
jgi:hypothetical protein